MVWPTNQPTSWGLNVARCHFNLIIVPARVQPIEVGAPINAPQHGFTVDHERAVAVAQRGL